MPLEKAQAVLKRLLPAVIFEQVYKLATSFYYTKQGIADWCWYSAPKDGDDILLVNRIKEILPYTMVGRGGLIATHDVVTAIEEQRIDGCIVECGVARGGTAALMLGTSGYYRFHPREKRDAWLFDSFEGLPEPTAEDGVLRKPQGKDRSSWDLAKGYCLGTQEEVEDLLFEKFGFSRDKVHLVKGWFQDTLPVYREKVGDIAVLRVDGDWFESTRCCLENLYDNVVKGGYIIIDDYGLVGCKKATDEFLSSREEHPEMTLDGRGGAWFRKS